MNRQRHVARSLVAAIWLCFLARAIFYASALPLWEGFDEYSHFAFVQRIALHHDLPDVRTANSSRQVTESLKLLPAPWLTHWDEKRISYEDYWLLPTGERWRRDAALRSISSSWERDPADPPLQLWEAQQTPLFYWIAAPIYWLSRNLTLPAQVWILRCLAALLASAVIPLTVKFGEAVGKRDLGIAGAVVLTSMPELMILAGRISNECLAVSIGSAAALASARIVRGATGWRAWILFGGAMGAALLTKAYFLALLPWMLIIFVWKRAPVSKAAAALAVCAAIAGWWYLRTWMHTGTITGQIRDVELQSGSNVSLITAFLRTSWTRVFDFVEISYIWLGGWSFLVVRSWMYRIVELAIAAAAVRLVWRRRLLDLMAPLGLLALGLAYHAVTEARLYGGAATLGYYLYAFAASEGILLAAGWGRWWRVLPIMFIALESFALWLVQLPYYSGLTAHVGSGGLPALRLPGLKSSEPRILVEHLAHDKPFGTGGMLAITLLFFCATAGLFAITFRRSTIEESPVLRGAADAAASR